MSNLKHALKVENTSKRKCSRRNTKSVFAPGTRVRLTLHAVKALRLSGRRQVTAIRVFLKDVRGGVRLADPLDGHFYCWNIADLEPVIGFGR